MALSDETLISQAVELKDSRAFGELVRRYQARILLLQRRLARDPSLAEDLAQESFLRAWQKLHTYRGSGSFSGWLAALSYNVFLQNRRSTRRRAETGLTDEHLGSETPDHSAAADLDRLLSVLPEQDQTILTLVYACGLTNVECGELLEMPSGTIKARVHRAKQRIQNHLTNSGREQGKSPEAERPGVAGKPRVFAQLTGA